MLDSVFARPASRARNGVPQRRAIAHRFANQRDDTVDVAQPERVGFAERLTHFRVLFHLTPVCTDEQLFEQPVIFEFVNGEQRLDVQRPRNADERYRYEVLTNHWQVSGEPRNALVHVVERLQVGQLSQGNQRLLEWIANRIEPRQQCVEIGFDDL